MLQDVTHVFVFISGTCCIGDTLTQVCTLAFWRREQHSIIKPSNDDIGFTLGGSIISSMNVWSFPWKINEKMWKKLARYLNIFIIHFALKTEINRTGEIVQKLRALTVLRKDLGSSSRTHTAAHSHLSLQFHRISHPLWLPWIPDIHVIHRHACQQGEIKRKINKKKCWKSIEYVWY